MNVLNTGNSYISLFIPGLDVLFVNEYGMSMHE